VTRRGQVTMTVDAGRKLTSRTRVRVTATVGEATGRVTVSPGRSAQLATA
jgi:ribosomal protein S5